MNLKFIDRVIKSYEPNLTEADMQRMRFFYGLWEDMDRWSKGPTSAVKRYTVPSEEELEAAWAEDKPVFKFAAPKIAKERFCAICFSLREYVCDEKLLSEEDEQELRKVNFRNLVSQEDMDLAAEDPEVFAGLMLEHCFENDLSTQVAHMAALVGVMALRVDLEGVAKAISKKQRKINKYGHNPTHCPICGSTPAMGKVGGENETDGRGKTLYCQQCGNEWAFERIRCVHCGCQNSKHLHYFNVEGDDSHRIYQCEECGQYTRTVFVEDALQPFSFEVEEVITARLDAIAKDPKFNQ